MQCCGVPFKIGDKVKWTVCKEHLEDGVDYAYEHHGQAVEPFMLTGRVSEIKARYYRGKLGPSRNNPDVQITYMIPAKTFNVTEADGWDKDIEDMSFGGYMVTLHDCVIEPERADPAE